MKRNPKAFVKRLYSFLEVDEDHKFSSINEVSNKTGTKEVTFKIPLINTTLYKLKTYVVKIKWLDDLLDKLRLKGFSRKIVECNKKRIKASSSRKDLSKKTYEKCLAIYDKDINRLEKLLNKDLSHWKNYE